MVTLVAFAPRRREQAPEAAVGTASKSSTTASTALWVLGLTAASTAITVAVCVPPPAPALRKNAYFLAISCFFFAGVGGVMSAVCMAATTHLRHRHATWREHMHVLLARLASVVGATFSTKTAMGMLGLAAASTAMNLQSVGQQPHQPPRGLDEIEYCYHLAISAVFFAGVAGVMAAVREGGQVAK